MAAENGMPVGEGNRDQWIKCISFVTIEVNYEVITGTWG